MPTVLRFAGLRVAVYPNDHRPAHVHVIGNGREAVVNLNCPTGPVELRENYRFSRRDAALILEMVQVNITQLCGAWEAIHGVA